MIEINATTTQEITDEFKRKGDLVKRAVIDSVLDVLEKKAEQAVFVMLKPSGIALKIEERDYLTALINNLDVLIREEDYERAAEVKIWINYLEANSETK